QSFAIGPEVESYVSEPRLVPVSETIDTRREPHGCQRLVLPVPLNADLDCVSGVVVSNVLQELRLDVIGVRRWLGVYANNDVAGMKNAICGTSGFHGCDN